MKMSPKSCGCKACTIGKTTKRGKKLMKSNERSFRRTINSAVKQGKEDIAVAPYGGYTD